LGTFQVFILQPNPITLKESQCKEKQLIFKSGCLKILVPAGQNMEKQEGNTLRDVTDLYYVDFQLIKSIKSFVVFQICAKFDFTPSKFNVSL